MLAIITHSTELFVKPVAQLQIPAGFVADQFGGVHVLLTGLSLWSLATGLNPMARFASNPFYTLVAMRVFLGLAQSVMMPSVSATTAKYVQVVNQSVLASCPSSP